MSRTLWIAVALLLAACDQKVAVPADLCPEAGIYRRNVDVGPLGDYAAVVAAEPGPDSLQSELRTAMNAPAERRDVLVLSGGGQLGAYGAGFLESFLASRSEGFSIVTGVSTGAFQATAAFLGDTDSIAAMVDGYDIEDERELATRQRTLFGLPTKGFLYSLAPARRKMDALLTRERLVAVAAAAAEGRKLYVGAVDVKDGQFYAFDLTAIAASALPEAKKRDCYRGAVFASAAVPVVYAPVVLGGLQYFDGGVRASAFLDEAVAAMAVLPDAETARSTLYILFDNYLVLPDAPEGGMALDPLPALNRARQIAFDQIDLTSLAVLKRFADRYDIRFARIPAGTCGGEIAAPDSVFVPEYMRCLIAAGRKDGAADAFITVEY